jgi:hypothetical protein
LETLLLVPFHAAQAFTSCNNFIDLWLSFPKSIRPALPNDRDKIILCFEESFVADYRLYSTLLSEFKTVQVS